MNFRKGRKASGRKYSYKDVEGYRVELFHDKRDVEIWFVTCYGREIICNECLIKANSYQEAKRMALLKAQEFATEYHKRLMSLVNGISNIISLDECEMVHGKRYTSYDRRTRWIIK
ncbi:hypothetical protein KA005_85065 [bacterium]|nr:hypothetical protein [bacterium]